VLKLRFAPGVADRHRVTYENGEGCPHLHGNFGAADLLDLREFAQEDDGWVESLRRQGEGWLV
jgi:hypothetical protein